MAQEVTVRLTDDMDGEHTAAETVVFALDGVTYHIDLSDTHAAELRADFGKYITHARKARNTKGSTSRRRRNDGESQTIRAWAATQGIQLAPRGRIPAHVVERYHRQAAAA